MVAFGHGHDTTAPFDGAERFLKPSCATTGAVCCGFSEGFYLQYCNRLPSVRKRLFRPGFVVELSEANF